MSAPESLFCNILQVQYTATVTAIKTVINIPLLALKLLKSNLQRVKLVLYAAVEAAADVLLAKLNAVFDLVDVQNTDEGMSFCRLAYGCKALMETLFDPNGSLLSFLSPAQKQQAKDNYEFFEQFICKNGLEQLVTNWVNEQIDSIEQQINTLEQKLLGATGLDQLTQAYLTKLQTPILNGKNIYELLDSLDDFAECTFSICNYIATSSNQKEEFYDKLQITKVGNGFAYVAGKIEKEIQEQDDRIRRKLQAMKDSINRWKTQKIREEGVKPDEVMS